MESVKTHKSFLGLTVLHSTFRNSLCDSKQNILLGEKQHNTYYWWYLKWLRTWFKEKK